jgi:hypothetical protein
MVFHRHIFLRILLLILIISSCVEPYDAPTTTTDANYLVVDGFLQTSGKVKVALSRAISLGSSDQPSSEQSAVVAIEEEEGAVTFLPHTANGLYESDNLIINPAKKYKLSIKVALQEYQSEWIPLKQSPPIDEVGYVVEDDQLKINVSTRDITNNSRYYRWNYTETFEYTTPYYSSYVIKGGSPVIRPESEQIYQCWRTQSLRRILLASTTHLSEDVVDDFQLLSINRGSLSISKKYSILVQQQALTEEAYNYWLNVQKTTESLGGLFDPLPSEVTGNLRCVTNPDEPVIGFFSGGTISEKRIYITPKDLPLNFAAYRYPYCLPDTILNDKIPQVSNPDALISPINGMFFPFPIIGYLTAESVCIDCRQLGKGVTTRPDFWE